MWAAQSQQLMKPPDILSDSGSRNILLDKYGWVSSQRCRTNNILHGELSISYYSQRELSYHFSSSYSSYTSGSLHVSGALTACELTACIRSYVSRQRLKYQTCEEENEFSLVTLNLSLLNFYYNHTSVFNWRTVLCSQLQFNCNFSNNNCSGVHLSVIFNIVARQFWPKATLFSLFNNFQL